MDKVGVDILVKYMWHKNPLKCVSWIATLKEYYYFLIREATLKDKNDTFIYKKYYRDKQKKVIKLQEVYCRKTKFIFYLKKFAKYVETVEKDYASWCLAYRCVLPEGFTFDEVPEINEEIQMLGRQAARKLTVDNDGSVQYQNQLIEIYEEFYSVLEKIRSHVGSIDVSVKQLENEFSKSYSILNDLLTEGQYGLLMLTTFNNESMHNVLKNHNGIKRLPNLVKLFDKIQTYFHKKRHLPSFFV